MAGAGTPARASVRFFSQTPPERAKASKRRSEAAKPNGGGKEEKEIAAAADGRPKPNPEDPFDFSDFEFGCKKGADHFEEELKKMRAGGRFTPDVIGAVRVRPDKKSGETFPLHELAAIVPKGGRNISVLVHEASFVKPVMSAVQGSPQFNQQPQRSEDNELELIIKVEPEKKDGLAKRAKEVCHAWREQIRAEKHKRDTAAKKWKKDKLVTSDDKTRHDKELQKLQDKKMAHVDTKEKEILQHIANRESR